ncbi:hypothetical protein NQ314_012313 [Rhamnusium bicolor]|uniref:Vitellogenin n=1 Tax=Rhamnusium bicolor TaxID=1586634 RepID=A0AAV8XBY5_9CUCU|nr:hypothetical protein NQ314_012313 [Rhamnusium bicolor]
MWSQSVLCLIVGVALASTNPGWKDGAEYIYNVRGRTFASLHEVDNQYSGILMKARLIIQPKSDGKLQAQISDAQYAQVHSHLQDGWNTEISDSELGYKLFGMSNYPFQIDMKDGVISDLIVNKEVPNWEANIIKSFVSQFQLNTNGHGALPSKVNSLPEDQGNSAVFKTMEETITGNTETLYDIHPIPEYVLQSKPWMARHLETKGDGEIIEVVKHKNYSNTIELPLYHYGFAEMGDWKPATNQMGNFFIRDSVSRAILTGKLKRFTVQNSYTVNEIIMSPTLNNEQKGSVVSMLNVTLETIQSQTKKIDEVSYPIKLGNLVYTYDSPFSGSNGARAKTPNQGGNTFDFGSEEYNRQHRSAMMKRMRRSIGGSEEGYSSSSSDSSEYKKFYKQDQPKMNAVPESPLLPLTTGYKGMSIKQHKEVNVIQSVQKIAQEIGNELETPERSLRKNTLIAKSLYSQSEQEPQYGAWSAFRDAVAESGTGPAFLTIQEWIYSKKVDNKEAARIVLTMTNAVRQPTLQYMQSFFDFIKKPEIQSKSPLNETALMGFTNLVRKVYVDKKQSSMQYPVESFGSFRTDKGKKFIKSSVIPYLTQQLQEAVSRADTYKIHAYIRALGNVGNPESIGAFEPYLEGKKQVSQFQRFMMVAATDKLAESYPEVAQSILFKIYQNAGESQEVRVAAVHQLMRTRPPTDMLQRMASYTNIDTQEHVNAAVKSSIESAANLKGEEYQYLRLSAKAAQPLLTKKNYGVQHGSNLLRSYFTEELKIWSKVATQSIGSDDEFYPKGFKYSIRVNINGLRHRFGYVQAMVSSIDELIHLGKLQTASYQQQKQKQEREGGEQKNQQFSSQKIAQILNIKADEREQLEGYFWMEGLSGYFQKFISFDNHSVERWPEEIRKFEDELKKGKNYHFTKLMNTKEIALSFPTEMGFPFLFTYDIPVLWKINGEVSGTASPQISMGNKLYKPDTVTFKTKNEFTLNSKIQSRLSFSTPFDHHQYSSGFDKNFQVHIPLNGKFQIDFKNGQVEAEIEPKESHEGARLFHYSTWPYTSMGDIKDFQPVSSQQNTHYIKQKNLHSFDKTLGKKETGMALRVQFKHERKSVNLSWLSHLLQKRDIISGLLSLWDDASIQRSEINVQYVPEQSSVRKYIVRIGYQQKYKSEFKGTSGANPESISDPLARRENLIDKIGEGYGKSNVDPKSRVMIFYKGGSTGQDGTPYEISLKAKSFIPNTNGLDLTYSMKNEPTADTQVELTFGKSRESSSKIKAELTFRRSDDRKKFLQEQPMYRECQREMREGNFQLPACANMTMNSNLLDRINVKVQHENIKPEVVDTIKSIYQAWRFNYFPSLHIEKGKGTGKENEIHLQARFDPDLRSANVSVKGKEQESTIDNIHVGELAKKIFVVHPVFHVRSRILGSVLGLHTYRPICVVDHTHSSTFNNKTYPTPIDKHWTVMLQYVPKEARHQERQLSVEEQLTSQTENYAVLVRKNSGSKKQKDIKITFSSPKTDFKVVDITMNPAQEQGYIGKKVRVTIDGKEVQVSDKQSHDINDDYVQIYGLPNGEVKFEIKGVFYTIYDGERVKLTVLDGKFRDSVRGLCGAFNDDKARDFLTSENCIAGDFQKFVRGYEIEGSEGEQQRQRFSRKSHECVPVITPLFANVISEWDTGRRDKYAGSGRSSGKYTRFQTRYVEQNGEICFTIRPMPVCSSKSRERDFIKKNVAVHCVQKSNVAQLWKNQIDKGSSPNFSHKKETKTVEMELPQSCSE